MNPAFFLSLVLSPIFAAAPLAAQGAPANHMVLFQPQFHPGETAHYAFWETSHEAGKPSKGALANKLPAVQNAPESRSYRVEGQFAIEFAPTGPGHLLSGTVRFSDLQVEDWKSSKSESDLEAALQQLEAQPMTVTGQADGSFKLSGGMAGILLGPIPGQPVALRKSRHLTRLPTPK